jgi:hypothetical protein
LGAYQKRGKSRLEQVQHIRWFLFPARSRSPCWR